MFKLTIDKKHIARLVFDYPGEKVNKFTPAALEELEELIKGIEDNKQIKALVITSAKKGVFIAGADLKTFEAYLGNPDKVRGILELGHRVFQRIADLPFPTFAVINGACLGGGLELSLACTYRIAGDNPKTLLGLPETTIGIYPAWGGTQRLPRLVGVTQGLNMILSGKPVDAKKAYKVGLVDAVYDSAFLDEKVEEFIEHPKKNRKKGNWLLEGNPIGRALIYWMSGRTVLKQTKGQYPAPMAALDVVKKTYGSSLRKGLQYEVDRGVQEVDGAFRYAPNLIYIFFNSDEMKKEKVGEGRVIHSGAVLGAGTMGALIAWLFSYRNIPVRLKDINWDVIGKGLKTCWDTYKVLIRKRKLKPAQANRMFHQISTSIDYSGFDKADIVVEAAVENLELKEKIFKELEPAVRNDCIIATNTSSLTIKELAPAFEHPERLIGLHFFNPPSQMPLVEIVVGEKTSPDVVQTCFDLCLKLKKTPVIVGDCSGFLVNRIFSHGMVEIMRMLEEGVPMERLEKLFLKFGMPLAPFKLADKIGNDVNLKAMKSYEKAYGSRMEVPKLLEKMNEKQFYGEKVGKGFYIDGKKVNPEISELFPNKTSSLNDEDILDRALLMMINEAARCLEEGVVKKPGYLDMALVFGVGFPPFRGGLLRYADSVGIAHLAKRFEEFEKRFGERYAPCALIREMAEKGHGFDQVEVRESAAGVKA